MPETDLSDLSGFESRLQAALVVEAARLEIAPDLPARVRARARRRRGGRRVAVGAFAAALVALAAVIATLPRGGRPGTEPASPPGRSFPLRPGSPVDHISDPGGGVLYGALGRAGGSFVVWSRDGGATWTPTGPAPCGGDVVLGVTFVDLVHGVVTCPSSYVVTPDGGRTWAHVAALGRPGNMPAISGPPMFPVAAGHGSLWVLSLHCGSVPAGACQSLASSTDGGASFATSRLRFGIAQVYGGGTTTSLQITGPGSGYLLYRELDSPLDLYATTDGWRTWTKSAVPCDRDGSWSGGFEVLAASSSVLYLWCARYHDSPTWDLAVYRSTDGGRTWQLRSSSLPAAFLSTAYAPADLAVFVAASPSSLFLEGSGSLVRSDDGGTTWHVVTTVGGAPLQATWVHFTDSRHGVLLDEAAGAGARFGWWTTSDGGATWHHAAQ